MKRVPVIGESVNESLILLGHFLLNKAWSSLGNCGEGAFNSSLEAKPAKTPYKESSSNRSGKCSRIGFCNACIKDQGRTFALVLKVNNFFLDDVLCSGDERFLEGNLLFSVKQHHWVEGWDTWNVKGTISEGTAMADRKYVCGESTEAVSVFVSELVVLTVQSILLESDSESI